MCGEYEAASGEGATAPAAASGGGAGATVQRQRRRGTKGAKHEKKKSSLGATGDTRGGRKDD